MKDLGLILFICMAIVGCAGAAAYFFVSGSPILGAISVALAVINVVTLNATWRVS